MHKRVETSKPYKLYTGEYHLKGRGIGSSSSVGFLTIIIIIILITKKKKRTLAALYCLEFHMEMIIGGLSNPNYSLNADPFDKESL